jgi:hypothetical protein
MQCYHTVTELQCHVIILMKFLDRNFSDFQNSYLQQKLNIQIIQFGIDFKTVRYIIDNIKMVQKVLMESSHLRIICP